MAMLTCQSKSEYAMTLVYFNKIVKIVKPSSQDAISSLILDIFSSKGASKWPPYGRVNLGIVRPTQQLSPLCVPAQLIFIGLGTALPVRFRVRERSAFACALENRLVSPLNDTW